MFRPLISLLWLFAIAALGAATPGAAAQAPADAPALVEEILPPMLSEAHVPGAAVSVVMDGRIVLSRGFGLARLDPKTPMRGDTVVRAGSVSKVMTALGVAALADARRLDVERPVSELLPWFTASAGGAPITTWDLVSHTAGFDDSIVGLHTYDRDEWTPLETYLRRHLPAPAHPAGRFFSYSSWNTALLGAVIEAVSGQDFAAYMDQSVFAPLGLQRTTFRVVDRPQAVVENEAIGYRYTGDGYVAYPYNYVKLPPGIALQTTADDMARVLLFFTGGLAAPSVISPEGLAAFQRTQFVQYPGVRGRAFGPSETFINGHRALFHDGNGIGFSSRLLWIPELRFGLFVSVNHALLDPGQTVSRGARVPAQFSEALISALFAEGAAAPAMTGVRRLSEPPSASVLTNPSAFTGVYRSADFSRSTVQKLGYLFDTFEVGVTGGQVSIAGRAYRETEPGLLTSEGERSAFLQPEGASGPARLLIGNSTYERIPPLETPAALMAALGGAALLCLTAIVGWAFMAFRSKARRLASAAACVGAVLPLVAVGAVAFGLFRMDPQDLFFGELGLVGQAWMFLAIAAPLTLGGWWAGARGGGAALALAAAGTLGLIAIVALFRFFFLI